LKESGNSTGRDAGFTGARVRRGSGRRRNLFGRRGGGDRRPLEAQGDPAILGAVGRSVVGHQRVALAVETHRDLLFRYAIGDQVFLDGQRTATGEVAVGEPVAAVVRVAIELDAVDARVGLEELQDGIELGGPQ